MSKLDDYLNMYYADDEFCEGALQTALGEFREGAISLSRLIRLFMDAARGRGSDFREVLRFADSHRLAIAMRPERWEAVKRSILSAEGVWPKQEQDDQRAMMALIQAMREIHAAELGPEEISNFLPAPKSPCGLLFLLDHHYGLPGNAETCRKLRLEGEQGLSYYCGLVWQAAEKIGMAESELEALHRRNIGRWTEGREDCDEQSRADGQEA